MYNSGDQGQQSVVGPRFSLVSISLIAHYLLMGMNLFSFINIKGKKDVLIKYSNDDDVVIFKRIILIC